MQLGITQEGVWHKWSRVLLTSQCPCGGSRVLGHVGKAHEEVVVVVVPLGIAVLPGSVQFPVEVMVSL